MEKDFDPTTMTRANASDVFRMYRRMWGNQTPKGHHMSIRTEVRALENHIRSLSSDTAEQLAIISKAQSYAGDWMITGYDHYMDVLYLVKRRIINVSKG
jgi:hypothetical protein